MRSIPLLLVILIPALAALSSIGAEEHPAPPDPGPEAAVTGGADPDPAVLEPDSTDGAAESKGDAKPKPAWTPPPDPFLGLTLPEEFGPGPRIAGRIRSDSGVPLENLRVRTTTWKPSGRGCFKPTYRLGQAEVRPDGTFEFRVDAAMLAQMPEDDRDEPFRVAADGHLNLRVKLDAGQVAELVRGTDLRGVDIILRRAAELVVEVRGVPAPMAAIHLPEGPAGGLGKYLGLASYGSGKSLKLAPGLDKFIVAATDDAISDRVSLAGRLAAGETTRITLRLRHRLPASLTIVLTGYRDGLTLDFDGERRPLHGPVLTIETLTGPHSLSITGSDPLVWESEVFSIPRHVRNHTLEIDIR